MKMAQITVDINQFKAVEHIITILFWMHPKIDKMDDEVRDRGYGLW